MNENSIQFRAPEEYTYETETEKIDVYSLGNVLFGLLQGEWPFEHLKHSEDAQELVTKGERPIIKPEFVNSTDPYTIALIKAMRACWIHDPVKRASSKQIRDFLAAMLQQHGVQSEV